jgi:hypothetical protein
MSSGLWAVAAAADSLDKQQLNPRLTATTNSDSSASMMALASLAQLHASSHQHPQQRVLDGTRTLRPLGENNLPTDNGLGLGNGNTFGNGGVGHTAKKRRPSVQADPI